VAKDVRNLDGDAARLAEKTWAYAFGLGICVAVAAPVLREARSDSYPLSTYPMFAYQRQKTRLCHVDGLDRAGHRTRIPPRFIANDEAMQAMRTVRLAVTAGSERTALLCERVANRLAQDAAFAGIVRVRVIEGQFDSLSYFLGRSEPEELVVHQECVVPGRA
jgi:hypothetical protein